MNPFKSKSYFIYSVLLFITLSSKIVSADELLKLDIFNENERPSYGENIVVIEDDQLGLKGITSVPDTTGKIEIPILLSSGDFEFTIAMFDSGSEISFFRTGRTKFVF